MFCPHCGARLPDGARFCPSCGAQLSNGAQSAPSPQPAYQQPAYQPPQQPYDQTAPQYAPLQNDPWHSRGKLSPLYPRYKRVNVLFVLALVTFQVVLLFVFYGMIGSEAEADQIMAQAVGLVPTVVLIVYLFCLDTIETEPPALLLKLFLVEGVLTALVVGYVEIFAESGLELFMDEDYGNYQKNAATGNPSSGITNDFDHGYKCSAWAEDEVKQADFIGIFPDSLRHADLTQPITRAEFAAVSVNMYCRMANTTVEPYSPNPFTDTNDRDVLRAYTVGITGGTGGTSFSPNINLTREQGATMLTRAYKRMIYPDWTLATDSQFPLSYSRPAFFADDAEISDYAYQSVNFMFQNNIINGIGGNKFGPKNNMTREAALAIAVRMIDNLEVAS